MGNRKTKVINTRHGPWITFPSHRNVVLICGEASTVEIGQQEISHKKK